MKYFTVWPLLYPSILKWFLKLTKLNPINIYKELKETN
jgi:hypothetical protein